MNFIPTKGRNFESALFHDICSLSEINKTRTTPYHPQSEGMVERFNRTLEEGLSIFVNENYTDWDKQIPLFMMAYRTAVHEETKVTPSQMMFGREIRVPIDLLFGNPKETRTLDNCTEYGRQLEETLKRVHLFARENLHRVAV